MIGKNTTINRISWILAMINALFCLISFILLSETHFIRDIVLRSLAFLFIISILGFLIIRYLLEKYFFRKIKLIYKMISNHKMDAKIKNESLSYDEPILETVEKEVNAYVAFRESEVNRLKDLEAYRKEYIGNVSHELKTPLFNAQGYVNNLIEGGLSDEKINRQFLEKAQKNLERLQEIVDDLESIYRLESNTITLDIAEFNIKELAEEVMEECEPFAKTKKIKLKFKRDADQDYIVKADRQMIKTAMINLVENSIKYGSKEGTTKISFYDIEKQILVEISDDGIGIKEEHIKHIFDRFYRVEKSRTRDLGGSGLGLSIVKHIMDIHQQKVFVRSTFGMGTTFGFTLEKGN